MYKFQLKSNDYIIYIRKYKQFGQSDAGYTCESCLLPTSGLLGNQIR